MNNCAKCGSKKTMTYSNYLFGGMGICFIVGLIILPLGVLLIPAGFILMIMGFANKGGIKRYCKECKSFYNTNSAKTKEQQIEELQK